MSDSYFSAPVHQQGGWIDIVDDDWWKETPPFEDFPLPTVLPHSESTEEDPFQMSNTSQEEPVWSDIGMAHVQQQLHEP
ncbi:hypothetical protein GpartN1_g6262.t1 [Galdieria partita]|uniref:Anaphase-promoting complex subunit 13 n=1 Tax=Galdieria partita TaxID=83374 RepID=A0A9C7USW9_9RHOD|nr:hypothetical protein GpartN1_g6262.t1 [Galdieria partita]